MASEKGPIATEPPSIPPSAAPQTSATTTAAAAAAAVAAVAAATVSSDALATDLGRAKSLKRARETTPLSSPIAPPPTEPSPSKIARLISYTRQSPTPTPTLTPTSTHTHIPMTLTGAAALAEERHRRQAEADGVIGGGAGEERPNSGGVSENPNQKVLSDLLAGTAAAMSRLRDAPPLPPPLPTPATTASGSSAADVASSKALDPVMIPPPTAAPPIDMKDASSQSAESTESAGVGSLGGEADGQVVHSPMPMDVDPRQDQRLYAPQPDAQMDDKTVTSLSYPGILPPGGSTMAAPAAVPRGMSLPMAGSHQAPDLAPRSPTGKKHKCPNCPTEFTRHHNLKSHMLTHSQEKPYVCQTCHLRFRRLHDLKRHSKLHTGEKPHVCPKCDRKFARGDALARHSKGAGGCAGRRASMGSFAADDDYEGISGADADDAAVASIMYDGAADGGDMTEEDRRRLSLSGVVKAPHAPGRSAADTYAAAQSSSSTYPPAGSRPAAGSVGGSLHRPGAERASSSMPNSITVHPQYRQFLDQQQQQQQQQHTAAPGLALPSHGMSKAAGHLTWVSQYPPADGRPPEGNAAAASPPSAAAVHHQIPGAARARALSGAAQPQSQTTRPQSQPQSQAQAPHPQGQGQGGQEQQAQQQQSPSQGQGHGQGSGTGGMFDNSTNLFASGEPGMWAYLQHLDDKVKQLNAVVEVGKKTEAQLMEKIAESEKRVATLTGEVATLRQQLLASQAAGVVMAPAQHQHQQEQQQPQEQSEQQLQLQQQ